MDKSIDIENVPPSADAGPDSGVALAGAGFSASWSCSGRKSQICKLPDGRKLTIRQLAERLGLTYGILFRELQQAGGQVEVVLRKYPRRSVLARRCADCTFDEV